MGRTLEENALRGVTEPVYKRGAMASLGSHSGHWLREVPGFRPRFPQLTTSRPPSSLAQCCPGLWATVWPRGEWAGTSCLCLLGDPGQGAAAFCSGFPICGGRSSSPAASWPSPGLPSVP